MRCQNLLRSLAFLWLAAFSPIGHHALAAASPSRVLYETRFEPNEGFNPDLTLIGQSGWIGEGSGGNGLVTDFFPGEGQHAFIGFVAPTNSGEFLNAWRPVNYRPGGTNSSLVEFSVLMSVEDSSSTTTNRDDFRWSVYNSEGDRLFTLDFDNPALTINYLLDDSEFKPTGFSFTNGEPYLVAVRIDFETNRWSATLNGSTLVTNLPITTGSLPLNFGDVDAVWAIRIPGHPGDNFMVFDNFKIISQPAESPPPPRLEAVEVVATGEIRVRTFGVAGKDYVLQAGTNLVTWVPIVTNVVTGDGFFDYVEAAKLPGRFYRVMEF